MQPILFFVRSALTCVRGANPRQARSGRAALRAGHTSLIGQLSPSIATTAHAAHCTIVLMTTTSHTTTTDARARGDDSWCGLSLPPLPGAPPVPECITARATSLRAERSRSVDTGKHGDDQGIGVVTANPERVAKVTVPRRTRSVGVSLIRRSAVSLSAASAPRLLRSMREKTTAITHGTKA